VLLTIIKYGLVELQLQFIYTVFFDLTMGAIIMKNFNFKVVALALSLTVFGSISANASISTLTFNSEGNAQYGNQFFVTDNAFSDSYMYLQFLKLKHPA